MPDNETTTNDTPTTSNELMERKWLGHYIDASFNGTSTSYIRLGEDLEEYNIEMNADVSTKKNIIGDNTTRVKGYEPQSSVDTYLAYEGDALFNRLYAIINERYTGSKLHTTVIDVLVNSSGEVVSAYRENVVVIPQSIGGDTEGINIPFEIHYNGGRVNGSFNTETKTFTPST